MFTKRQGQRLIGLLMASAALLGALAAVHAGMDIVYQPNCPACQQESHPGCQVSAISLSMFVPEPLILYFLHHSVVLQEHRIDLFRELPPRSPPPTT